MNIFIEINHTITLELANFVDKYNIETFIWIMADLPIFLLPIFLVVMWLKYTFVYKEDTKKSNLLNLVYITIFAVLINIIVQHFFDIQRPDSIITPILHHVPDASFPSDHAAVSIAFLTWLFLFNYKKSFWIFLPLVIVMNFSRMAWWLHWFFDVIVWSLIWIFTAIIFYKKIKDIKYIIKINNFVIKMMNYIKL